MEQHKRIIIVGPTCSGKSYIRDKFREKGFNVDVSYTSREPREGETHNVDYKFLTKFKFEERIYYKRFYEFVKYGDNYYGTGIREWNESAVFIMETDGIKHITAEDRKDCLIIYVNTPWRVRQERMIERGWDNKKIQERKKIDKQKFENFIDFDIEISSEENKNR